MMGDFMKHYYYDNYNVDNNENDVDFVLRMERDFHQRYNIDLNTASIMAVDFVDIITAVDGNFGQLKKYFFN